MPFNHTCPHCGNLMQIEDNLRDLQVRCPICTEIVDVPASPDRPSTRPVQYETITPVRTERKAGLAISSLVFGILGLPSFGVLGLLGLILGVIAIKQANRDTSVDRGKGFAIAGLIMGLISFLFFGALLVTKVVLPSIPEVRKHAIRTACATHLQVIYEAMEAHAGQNKGRYPRKLNVLVEEGLLSNEDLVFQYEDRPDHSQYRYVGGQKNDCQEEAILVYEDLANHGEQGGNVLFCGGEVRFVPSSRWQRVISKGKAQARRRS